MQRFFSEVEIDAPKPFAFGWHESENAFERLNPPWDSTRLVSREGNIENSLIYYQRENTANAKLSSVLLYEHNPNPSLKQILTQVHGVKVVVDKVRRIYFIDNVKFHFDTVDGLGTFVEVEAIGEEGKIPIEKLKEQCNYYFNFFGLKPTDYVALSYSDLLQ